MFEHIILGIVQGLTEFLPISSSGHLVLLQSFLGFTNPEENLLYDTILHFATLIAVLIYFRSDILLLIKPDIFSNKYKYKLILLLVVANIPTGIIGIAFKDYIEKLFASPNIVCFTLFFTGLLLLISEKISHSNTINYGSNHNIQEFDKLSYTKAFIIGITQGIAITPGISRSGSTIAVSKMLGLNSNLAVKFSFLISIPAISGALLLQILKVINDSSKIINFSIINITSSFCVSLIFGLFSLNLINYIAQNAKLHYFSYYLFVVSCISFITLNFLK